MADVNILVLELSLAPCLILLSSLAQQRWGQRVSGLIVGLPLTSLPLLFLLSLAHGAHFAAAAATSSLEASCAQALLIWVYAAVARRGGVLSGLAASAAAFGAGVAILDPSPRWPALVGLGVGVMSYVFVLIWWPGTPGRGRSTEPERLRGTAPAQGLRLRYRLVIRMVIAAMFAAVLTGASGILGSHLSGLVSAFPVITFVMGGLTHKEEGSQAAVEFLYGVAKGSFAVVTSLFALAVLLPSGNLPLAFGLATMTAVATQAVASVARGARIAPGVIVEA
ncbi:MAG: hypothetical protein ACP5P1_09595 [Acidimicrobiales bacterium]